MPPSLIIGIDARAADEIPAGRGRVVRELLGGFAARSDDYRYMLYSRRRPRRTELDHRFQWRARALGDPGWALWAAASANRDCDVFLSPSSYLLTCLLRVPSAMIVHDLVPFVAGIPSQRRARIVERLTLRAAIARVDTVLCVSRSTRNDLIARYPGAEHKTSTVPLAAGTVFGSTHSQATLADVRKRYWLPPSFVLSVGTLEPRKNLQRLADAHAGLPETLQIKHPLALVGPSGWDRERSIRAASARDAIRILGFVAEEDLAALYAASTVFCYPSLYEGFGLPVLEAMQSGTPTITSRVSSLPEVAGDAAYYVDPYSVPDIRRALSELLTSPTKRAELARRGRSRAAAFTWARTVEQMLAILSSVAGR